ncbi:pyrroline-5-carboxylate reductase [Paenarthrobacter sp. A20]|uniref:pyrroline-5-carboxylate reductase n=1 Tax=Paenarthrobacter sp. A20 TaxID=2817891 RepID=UPI0021131DB0|nr:pyrroline-5-carboxylate reductase [Paenarthrobacter sp. A20]
MPPKTPEHFPRIAVLGTGAMGGAIVRGLLKSGATVSEGMSVSGHWTQQMQELTDLPGVEGFDAETDPEANIRAVRHAGIVVLALKPDVMVSVLREISSFLRDGAIVISVAAGVTIQTIESLLPETVSVIRVMPNTPALVGMGVSGISTGTRGTMKDISLAEALFGRIGTVLRVPESRIDEVTSISGSGPAYVYYLIEQLTTVAEHLGFTSEQAALLVNGTFRGACELLVDSDKSPRELRQLVTSPKGTTAAAISVLEDGGLRELFERAAAAAVRRARELAI